MTWVDPRVSIDPQDPWGIIARTERKHPDEEEAEIRLLTIASALIAAEIDRRKRLGAPVEEREPTMGSERRGRYRNLDALPLRCGEVQPGTSFTIGEQCNRAPDHDGPCSWVTTGVEREIGQVLSRAFSPGAWRHLVQRLAEANDDVQGPLVEDLSRIGDLLERHEALSEEREP